MSAGFDRPRSHPAGSPTTLASGPDDVSLRFPDRVYAVVARIPWGQVTTYGAIARALGSPRSARMVGWALRFAPANRDLPCHRVVNRIGFLSGGEHFGHPDVMRGLLLAESVPFCDDYQVDLAQVFWDPASDPALDHLFRANS